MDKDGVAVGQIARYGLPLVVLVFYFTASQTFDYTPASAYVSMALARDVASGAGFQGLHVPGAPATPNPLWVFLLAVGSLANLDVVLEAKVFSLLFSSMAILCTFLVAVEVLRDRLIAFCAAFVVALHCTLLQAGPSGSPLPLGMALSLAGLFFLLRNEYILAALFFGLCTDVFWQGSILLLLLLADITANSVIKSRAPKRVGLALLVFLAPVIPWLAYASMRGIPVFPALVPFGDFPEPSSLLLLGFGALVCLAAAGVVALLRAGGDGRRELRSHFVPLLWMLWCLVWGLSGGFDLTVIVVPLFTVYAFFGLIRLVGTQLRDQVLYTACIALSALLLLQNQLAFGGVVKPLMTRSIEASVELGTISSWIRKTLPDGAPIGAANPGVLWLTAKCTVLPGQRPDSTWPEYVVSADGEIPGYTVLYSPSDDSSAPSSPADLRYAVWKKVKDTHE